MTRPKLTLPWHDTLACARQLLGMHIVRHTSTGLMRARIVETEAYHQDGDAASHSFRGETARNHTMFGPPGHWYVYLIYGMYHCLNVVTEPSGVGAAVLIRGLEPLAGITTMGNHRPQAKTTRELCNGPGKLCQAMAIDRNLDGHPTNHLPLRLQPGEPPTRIHSSSRIGISKGKHLPWRFFIAEHPCVSKGRPAT